MQLKKFTQKDRYGNTTSYEFEGSEKPLDPTRLMEKQMELDAPDFEMDITSMMVPPVMGEEFNMGDPNNHPGEPMGSDTVPAWLTPGEFVVNKEATEMFGPEIEAMNEVGKMAKGGAVPQQHHRMPGGHMMAGETHYADGGKLPPRGSAAQIMAGMDPASIVRMMGNLGNAYQFVAPALGMEEGGDIPMPMSMTDALLHSREGYRPEVYLDSLDKPTVGYGHLLPDEFTEFVGQEIIPEDQLNKWFEEDRDKAQKAAKDNVGAETWDKLNKRQQATLSSMAFQLGGAGQKKFKNMIKAIQNDDYREAAKQALTGSKGGKSKWLKQTPVRALDLAEAFDPEIAAQYRDAGGVVYDDMPVQYAFFGDFIKNLAGVPEPGVVQIPEGAQKNIYDKRAADAGAAPAMTPEELEEVDFAAAQAGGLEDELEVPPAPNAATEDMGLLGKAIDFFGGPSDVANVEAEERNQQAANAAVAAAEAEEADYASKAEDAINAGDYEAYARYRKASKAAADAKIEAQKAQAQVEAENREKAKARGQEAYSKRMGGLADAIRQAEEEGDQEAVDRLKAQQAEEESDALAAELTEGVEDWSDIAGFTPPDETPEDEAKKKKNAAIYELLDNTDAEMYAAAGIDPNTRERSLDAIEGTFQAGRKIEARDAKAAAEQEMANDPNYTDKVRSKLEDSLGPEIGGALGELFDAGELAKMMVYAGGSMLMGASPMQALNFGLKQYLGGLDKKSAAKAKEQATRNQQAVSMSGKYTPQSLAKYQKTGSMADLVPVATATKPPKPKKLTDMKVHVPGVGLVQVWEHGDGTQFYKGPNNSDVRLEGSGAQVYDKATMGDVAIRDEFSNYASSAAGVMNQGIKEGDEGYVAINKQKIGNEANRLFQETIRSSNMAVNDAQALRGEVGGAVDDYLAAVKAAKETGTDMPTSIKPFFESRMMSIKTGVNKSLLLGSTTGNQNKLNNQILSSLKADGVTGDDATRGYQKIFKNGETVWATLSTDEKEKYTKIGKEKGASGFTYFLERLVADDEKALKAAEKAGLVL